MPQRSSGPGPRPAGSSAARPRRRGLLRAGGLAGLGLLLPDLLRARDRAGPLPQGTFGRAKSVIVLYLHGGHAQQETWDPKPDGPSPARGEFGAISTRVPGVRFSELLPPAVQIADKLAVIRSLRHPNANHVQATLPPIPAHPPPPSSQPTAPSHPPPPP